MACKKITITVEEEIIKQVKKVSKENFIKISNFYEAGALLMLSKFKHLKGGQK
jgi:hypothetical protein